MRSRILHNIQSVAFVSSARERECESAPCLSALACFSGEEGPTVGADAFGLVHRGEEGRSDGHFARGERFDFGLGEGEAGEEEMDEGLAG